MPHFAHRWWRRCSRSPPEPPLPPTPLPTRYLKRPSLVVNAPSTSRPTTRSSMTTPPSSPSLATARSPPSRFTYSYRSLKAALQRLVASSDSSACSTYPAARVRSRCSTPPPSSTGSCRSPRRRAPSGATRRTSTPVDQATADWMLARTHSQYRFHGHARARSSTP